MVAETIVLSVCHTRSPQVSSIQWICTGPRNRLWCCAKTEAVSGERAVVSEPVAVNIVQPVP